MKELKINHYFIDPENNQNMSNLGDLNADFSKPPDFSNLSVSPDLFCYRLIKKYYRFFEFRLFEKFNFSNEIVGPDQRNSY